jgi:hypothetical protein
LVGIIYYVSRSLSIGDGDFWKRCIGGSSPGHVRAKIAGDLKERQGTGNFTCYFDLIGKLYTWSYEELRSIIGKEKR